MKKLYTLIAILLINMAAFAQAPQKMSYQAVIRNASNALINNQSVGMQISVLQGSSTGTPVYVETQTQTTNANGLVNLEIGTGTVVSGTFASIDWSSGTYYIKTETDPTGGTSYTINGTSQLLSVPYALYAGNSSGGLGNGAIAGNTPYWNGTNWVTNSSNIFNNGTNVGINTSSPDRLLEVHSNITYSAGQTASLMLSDNFQKWNLGLGYSPAFRFSIASEDSTERFVIQQTGNVGIGTINPLAKLDVAGNIKIADGTHGAGKVLTSDANGLATWTTPGAGTSNLADGTAVGNTPYWDGTKWAATSSNLFNNGTNVGIGTTTPTSQLDIMGTTESRSRFRYGSETAGLTIGNWSNEAYVYNELNTDLVFGTNSATRIRIKNDGNVGIGTDTPGAKLDVAGAIKITDGSQGAGKILTSDANGLATWTTPATTNLADGTAVGNTPYWNGTAWENNSNTIFNDNTNVGIGTATPGAKLDVAGTIKITDGSQGAGKILTSDANGLATWATPAAAPSYYHLYNVYGVPSSSFQLGLSGTMVTFAIYNNCTGMKAYGGTMMINPAGNVTIINYTAVDATGATMSATGNVISLESGCGTITITLNVSGSSCTMTTGGVGGAYTEAKMTVIAM